MRPTAGQQTGFGPTRLADPPLLPARRRRQPACRRRGPLQGAPQPNRCAARQARRTPRTSSAAETPQGRRASPSNRRFRRGSGLGSQVAHDGPCPTTALALLAPPPKHDGPCPTTASHGEGLGAGAGGRVWDRGPLADKSCWMHLSAPHSCSPHHLAHPSASRMPRSPASKARREARSPRAPRTCSPRPGTPETDSVCTPRMWHGADPPSRAGPRSGPPARKPGRRLSARDSASSEG